MFVPRLSTTTPTDMTNNPWWYSSGNVLYAIGYGLPNCTCYAYGRYAEIRNAFAPLPTGNAGNWWAQATGFAKGQTPQLGSIACYTSRSGSKPGHVAVVEEINGDQITTSNSGYGGPYFFLNTTSAAENYTPAWMSESGRDYYLQGFIYNDAEIEAVWSAKAQGAYARTSQEAYGNAICIYTVLSALGWTLNAVAGILGNIEYESGYNPWRWQNDILVSQNDAAALASLEHGYGLFQFTPANKYIGNPNATQFTEYAPNFSDAAGNPDDGSAQLRYMDGYSDYSPSQSYPVSFSDYKQSTDSPEYCASIWLYNYERPANPGATEYGRRQAARYWFDALSGYTPGPDPGPWGTSYKMPLYMYLKRRFFG